MIQLYEQGKTRRNLTAILLAGAIVVQALSLLNGTYEISINGDRIDDGSIISLVFAIGCVIPLTMLFYLYRPKVKAYFGMT